MHLATSGSGGAGIAASRLHSALVASGHESIFLTLGQHESRGVFKKSIYFLLRKLFTFLNKLNTRSGYIQTSAFSLNSISLKNLDRFTPDIIHIHNWYNMLSMEGISEIANSRPTLLTLHDERIYTGACHYSLGCDGYLRDCAGCPAVYGFRKKIISTKNKFPGLIGLSANFSVVAPSQWLLSRLDKTALGQRVVSSACIPNIIPISDTREVKGGRFLFKNDLQFLFAAVDPGLPTKGLDLLEEALFEIASAQPDLQLTLHIVGNPIEHQTRVKNLTFEYHGFLTHDSLGKLFRDIDLVVVPSRVDNSPSVVSEAQISGALVLATNVGGIPELIEDSVTGFLCEPNTESLRKSILRVIASEQNYEISKAGQESALRRHDSNEIVTAHLSIYQKIVENG